MTEQEKIISLAREHWHRDNFNIKYFDTIAFYKAAQNEAYEKAALALDKLWNGDTDTYMRADNYTRADTCNECAAAIRSLKGQS